MKSLRTIFRYISRYPKLIAAYFSFNILSAVFSVFSLGMLSPFLLLIFRQGETFQTANEETGLEGLNPINYLKSGLYELIQQPNGSVRALLAICLIIFVAILLKNFFAYLSVYYLNPIRNHIIKDMRAAMYHKILRLPVGYFSDQRKGEIMSRLSNDLNDVESSTISVLESTFKEPIVILFSLVYMVILSPQLTLFLLLFLPIAGLILGRIGRTLKKKNRRVLEQFGSLFSTIEETLGGMRVIQAFNAEKRLSKNFDAQNERLFKLKNTANRRRDLASPVSEFLGVTAVLCILYYGGRLVLNDSVTFGLNAGDFLAFIAIFSQMIQPIKALSNASYNLQRGAAGIERIKQLIDEPVTIVDDPNAKQLSSFEDAIELRNVHFSYGDKKVLHNINLELKKGKTIALVGSSGSGKSTLADLIPRFIDAHEGTVMIDGIDVKQYSLQSLRNQMGIVTQEAILFNDTIANNIRLAREGATDEAVKQAAGIANASTFIEKKEAGYETNIGERGSKLSGGEKQRLTIARAVLKNPPILILDEATSALDTESERLVQDALNNLMSNRTTLVIAHRLSTVRHADEIIVMHQGHIAERGTHETLMAMNGIYRKLIDMQEVK